MHPASGLISVVLGKSRDGEEVVGASTKVKVIKNKVYPPFREAEPSIMYAKAGFDKTGDLLDLAASKGVVEKAGAWYKYKGTNIGQGKPKTLEYLETNPTVLKQVQDDLAVFFNPATAGEIPLE
jgi:recombination protein RecA